MENKIYNDDVERIVNDPDRVEAINNFHRKRHHQQQRKMLIDAVVCAVVALIFGLFGCVGFLAPWVSVIVTGIVGLYSSFLFGRFVENGKCYGWY